jgi:two-component system, cell cycle sensor histidine kinase and response regulator CckA
MNDVPTPEASLDAEIDRLRVRVAELEASAAEHQRAEQQLERDARRSEAALRRSEDTARAVLESASEGIILIDRSGRITLVNMAAERMFGYPGSVLLGESLEILLPERTRRSHVAHRKDYFAEPRVRPMGIGLDLSGRRLDGTEFPVEISLSHVESAGGGVAIAFITDITERKRVEAQLQHQREVLYQNEKLAALGTMAAGIAHEMNNPLGIITTRIEVMLLDAEQQQLPAQVLEDLQVLHRASQRVARIAASLRSFARHTPGDQVPLDLNAVVEESLRFMQKPLAADNVQIVARLDRTLPPILGDATTLHQVLMNLLTNASEAMPEGGQVRLETGPAERPGWVRLLVADTGAGIAAEEISKIFDPFFTTKRTGTGLGLSVSYGIIQEHGGTVDVQSRPGAGTTFIVSFPTTSAAAP